MVQSIPAKLEAHKQYQQSTNKSMRVKTFSALIVLICIIYFNFWFQLLLSPEISIKYPIKDNLEDKVPDVNKLMYSNDNVIDKIKYLKYILLWTDKDKAPLNYLGNKYVKFVVNNCPVKNCYVTDNRNYFDGDLTKFDAIAFNGRGMRTNDLPKQRSPHQKYIYFNMESSAHYPVCDEKFDNFFNWTATYKLNSDIYFGYILIKNASGHVVGPKKGMKWEKDYPNIKNKTTYKIGTAAWFASRCITPNKREIMVSKLSQILEKYGQRVDVYGNCGHLSCPKDSDECDFLLKTFYYFYLSFENSFDEDYVTEKLLTALSNDVVPIVYGGADYSRFLPPGSYLDARKMNVSALAATMINTMSSPELYQSYFRWKGLYEYSDPTAKENICGVCAALNDKGMFEKHSVKKEFRKWWRPNYFKYKC